jgi:hypothetical protein
MANGTIAVSSIEMLSQSGTGITTIAPPATNSNFTQTLVPVTGTLAPLVSGTAVASTSGTSIDFTGIPSWVKRITVMFGGVSTNGSSIIQVQLGDAGGVENTGYAGLGGYIQNSAASAVAGIASGFAITAASSAASVYVGSVVLTLLGNNQWIANGSFARTDSVVQNFVQGSKTLSDTLTQVRITTVNGTDTFDAGNINILYE